jgi:subtilisin family serine protease
MVCSYHDTAGGGTYAPHFWGREGTVQTRTSIEDAVGTPAGTPDATTPEAHGRKHSVDFLKLVRLAPLMELSRGSPEIVIGLMDGPVVANHPDLATESVREIAGEPHAGCAQSSAACIHGTFTAGILSAKRGSSAPAICPGCTLLVRPIFKERAAENGVMPSASPEELAGAIVECIGAGACVLNLSAAFAQPSSRGARELEEALDYAARLGVIVVAAAGNQGTLVSSAITRHPWVIPVAACDLRGRPVRQTNLGSSVGRRGLLAPGEGVTSLGAEGAPLSLGGTSVAAPFVTGSIALLWAVFQEASAAEVKNAVAMSAYGRRRTSVVPPLLDAWAGYQTMVTTYV